MKTLSRLPFPHWEVLVAFTILVPDLFLALLLEHHLREELRDLECEQWLPPLESFGKNKLSLVEIIFTTVSDVKNLREQCEVQKGTLLVKLGTFYSQGTRTVSLFSDVITSHWGWTGDNWFHISFFAFSFPIWFISYCWWVDVHFEDLRQIWLWVRELNTQSADHPETSKQTATSTHFCQYCLFKRKLHSSSGHRNVGTVSCRYLPFWSLPRTELNWTNSSLHPIPQGRELDL